MAVLEEQPQVGEKDMAEGGGVVAGRQLLTHLVEQLVDGVPLGGLHAQRLSVEIGEEGIVAHAGLQIGVVHQLGRPQHGPAADGEGLAVIFAAAYLTGGHGDDGGVADLQGADAVEQVLGIRALDEQAIDVVMVQAVADGRDVVEVDDAQQGVLLGGAHMAGEDVGGGDSQDILHIGRQFYLRFDDLRLTIYFRFDYLTIV